MTAEQFAPIAIGISMLTVLLIVIMVWVNHLPLTKIPNPREQVYEVLGVWQMKVEDGTRFHVSSSLVLAPNEQQAKVISLISLQRRPEYAQYELVNMSAADISKNSHVEQEIHV